MTHEWEKYLLNILKNYPKYRSPELRSLFLEKPHQWIFDALLKVGDIVPTAEVFYVFLPTSLSETQKAATLNIFNELDLFKGDPNLFDFYVDRCRRRVISEKLKKVMSDYVEGSASEDEIISLLVSSTTKLGDNFFLLGQALPRFIDDVLLNKREIKVSWGIPSLDLWTEGLVPGRLHTIFGRPGVGKSRFMLNLSFNVAHQGIPTLFVTLEMPSREVMKILSSRIAFLSYDQLFIYGVDDAVKAEVKKRITEFSQKQIPLFISEDAYSLSQIASRIEQLRTFYKDVPIMVVVDYGYLIDRPSNLSREEGLGEIWKSLKKIARKYDVIMVTAAQQTRQSASKKAEQISQEHVAQSDAIVQHSDIILHIYTDAYLKSINKMQISLKKNRWGPIGQTLELFADLSVCYIGDMQITL